MNLWTSLMHEPLILLAGQGEFVHLGSRFRSGGSESELKQIVMLLAMLAVVAGFIWLLSRLISWKESSRYFNKNALFRELCKAHRLDRSTRHLLLQLARSHSLEDPARLFVEPDRFDLDQLADSLADQRTRIGALHDRLFARPNISVAG